MTVLEPNPHQHCFIQEERCRYVLGDGGRGGGKSWMGCVKGAIIKAKPGTRFGIFRKKLVDLKRTTLRTLLEGDGHTPPVLPQGSYTHNKAERYIRYAVGGGTAEIVYDGFDQADKSSIGSTGGASSLNLTHGYVDEVVELTEGDWIQLDGAIRVQIPGVKNQLFATCNPGPPSHWLVERFGLTRGHRPAENHARVFLPIDANIKHLGPEFIAAMDALSGVARERYRLGKWVGSDGLVYDNWDRRLHVTERDRDEMVRWSLGVDEGVTNPFAALLIGYDPDGRAHVFAEAYETGLTHERMVDQIEALGLPDLQRAMYDSAAKALGMAMRERGLPAVSADKGEGSVVRGIQKVRQRLETDAVGVPRLTVSPSCTNLIREFESHEWKPDRPKDEPKKENDHALDGLRYEIDREDESAGLSVFTGEPIPKTNRLASVWDDPTFR